MSRTRRSAEETALASAAKAGAQRASKSDHRFGFGARGGDGGEVDGQAAVRERARGGPGGLGFIEGRDQDDRPGDFVERVITIIGLQGFDGVAGRNGAEGLGDFDGDAVDMIENQNPVVLGEMEELAVAHRKAAEKSCGGID